MRSFSGSKRRSAGRSPSGSTRGASARARVATHAAAKALNAHRVHCRCLFNGALLVESQREDHHNRRSGESYRRCFFFSALVLLFLLFWDVLVAPRSFSVLASDWPECRFSAALLFERNARQKARSWLRIDMAAFYVGPIARRERRRWG